MPKIEKSLNGELRAENIIGQNLKHLRIKSGLTLEEMSIKLRLSSKSAYRNYEVAVSVPPIAQLIILSEFFEVSIDALCKKKLFEGEITFESEVMDRLRRIENHLMI